MAKRKSKSAYQQITSKLGQLTHSELDDLIEVAMVLREAMDKSPEEVHKEFLKVAGEEVREGRKPKRGHVEQKLINGYGPYLYLRYWRGGKLRSTYLGKGRAEEE